MRQDRITVSLGLPEFGVLQVYEGEGLISVEVVERDEFALCPECGRITQHFHDDRVDDVWDIPILGKGVKLLVVKRRWWCDTPGCKQTTPFTERFDSLDAGQHRTHRLNAYIYRLTKRMPNTEVVRELARCHIPISDCTVGRLQRAFAEREVARRPMRKRRVIGMDEFSIEKRHTYATVITDPIHREIVDTFEKRDEETVVEHLSRLPHKESIQAAVIDMSRSFRSAIREALPGCHIVADKFHVVATVIDALDRVRKRVQREKAKGHRKPVYDLRYKLRKGRERLDDEETHELWTILAQEPDLRIAYFLKEAFRDWYHRVSRSSAQRQLELWCDWAKASGLPEMLEAARTLQNWKEEISNYFT